MSNSDPLESTPDATEATLVAANSSGHRRLTLTDSTLEAVPEEPGTSGSFSRDNFHPQTTPINAGYSAKASFHIPESNASDIAPSECSSHLEMSSQHSAKSETLTARQQVMLWLTRTSMSDLSSMPSLRSLVQSKVQNNAFKAGSSASSSTKGNRGQRHFQRNFSTKSLVRCEEQFNVEDESEGMRKCETVIAFAGMSSTPAMRSKRKKEPGEKPLKSVFKPFSKSRHSVFNSQQINSANKMSAPGSTTCESPYPGVKPTNRLRTTGSSSVLCSRCTSAMSVNQSHCTSQISLLKADSACRKLSSSLGHRQGESDDEDDGKQQRREPAVQCKICLADYKPKDVVRLQECQCQFCKECMMHYVAFEIMEGAYEISCPDPGCEKQGILQPAEIEIIAGKDMMDKHNSFRLNTEVALDANRAWCPKPGCDTICHICSTSTASSRQQPTAVTCPKCDKQFCSMCSSNWHPDISCHENGKRLVVSASASATDAPLLMSGNNIKRCPMCQIPIERDAGCAQMMCKRCKHVFCWFCLASLDDDFLLRHYDSGACKGRLGHSRASILWHRAQVIGIFAGFVVLLVVASPLLLVTAPCIFCFRCKSCAELEEEIGQLDEAQMKLSRSNSGITIQVGKE